MRASIRKALDDDGRFEVVGTASCADIALRKIPELSPDVLTMDIEMPGLDGIELVRRVMTECPTPTVMFSSHTQEGAAKTFEALDAGAVDYVGKPGPRERRLRCPSPGPLCEKLFAAAKASKSTLTKRAAARPKPVARKSACEPPRRFDSRAQVERVVAVGISMGGPATLAELFAELPADIPPLVITLHMPEAYTSSFAKRLDELSACEVREARSGDRLRPGLALLARGDHHLRIERVLKTYRVELVQSEKVSGHRPSIDVMLESLAGSLGDKCAAVLMTGMGADGANGLAAIRAAGGKAFVQDEESSVVFGMGSVAIKRGHCDAVLGLPQIGELLGGASPAMFVPEAQLR